MGEDMELKTEHVVVEDLVGRPVAELQLIAAECDSIKEAAQLELQRQADVALEALKATRAGVGAGSNSTAPKKRGPKSKAEKEAAANGHAVDDDEDLIEASA